MYGATMQLIKAQAYEMIGHNQGDSRVITQFNLISLTEGNFVALNFGDDNSIVGEEITEQVGLTSYKINDCDHDSRILYLTKASFETGLSRFATLHKLNVEFFGEREAEFRNEAVFDMRKRALHIEDFIAHAKNTILRQTQSFSTPPYIVPDLDVSLVAESLGTPIVVIAAQHPEILEASYTPYVREQLAHTISFYWGYEGEFELKVINKK